MTTEELDQELLDQINEASDNTSFETAEIRYRILSRAYRYVIRNSWVTHRAMSTFSITQDDESFNLTSKLSLAAGYGVHDVVRCFYLVNNAVQHRLAQATLGEIKAMRSADTGSSDYPVRYAFYRLDSSGTKIPTLDIYPAVRDSGSSVLFLDWIEMPPDLSASQDPITSAYADDAIATLAAAYALQRLRDVGYTDKRAEAEMMVRSVRGQSFREASGIYISEINL